ncbi:MAG: CD225/dispanin family protein [Phycisphaerales bacterium]
MRSGEVVPRDEDPGIGPVAVPLALAILSALFCCQPIGIVAVVYAALAMGRNSAGAYSEAKGLSENARKWARIAIALGLIVQIIYLGFVVAGYFSLPPKKP